MKKTLTCIECPKGCQLKVFIKNERVIEVTGNQCPKGDHYARQELENPTRTLTSTIATQRLSVPMIPVRTTGPIPKPALQEAMLVIKQMCVTKPVKANQILKKNFLSFNVDLITTRSVD